MSDNYLTLIKVSLRELNLIYNNVLERLKDATGFDHEKEIDDFYKDTVEYFLNLDRIITDKKVKFSFFDELELNIQNENYFKRLDLIFDRQLNFVSRYEEAINVYFNDKKDGALVLEDLNKKFHNVRTPENIPHLLMRNESDMNEITVYIKDNFEDQDEDHVISDHLILDMIYEQDLRLYGWYGDTPYDFNFVIHKAKFIHAIKLYYVDLFSRLEDTIKEASPYYRKKLINIHYLERDRSNYISLKQEYNNIEFKHGLFNLLVNNHFLDCEREDFESLFFPSEIIINWKGSQKQLMLLFKGNYTHSITNPTIDVSKSVASRFTCNNIQLKIKQLRVSHNHVLRDIPKGIISNFLSRKQN